MRGPALRSLVPGALLGTAGLWLVWSQTPGTPRIQATSFVSDVIYTAADQSSDTLKRYLQAIVKPGASATIVRVFADAGRAKYFDSVGMSVLTIPSTSQREATYALVARVASDRRSEPIAERLSAGDVVSYRFPSVGDKADPLLEVLDTTKRARLVECVPVHMKSAVGDTELPLCFLQTDHLNERALRDLHRRLKSTLLVERLATCFRIDFNFLGLPHFPIHSLGRPASLPPLDWKAWKVSETAICLEDQSGTPNCSMSNSADLAF